MAVFVAVLAASLAPCSAQGRPVPGHTDIRLDNGLELVVVEDRSTPFARIDLAFRAGAIAQGASTAGHFHILEHILLDGPVARLDGAASKSGVEATGSPVGSLADAVAALGPLSWNGETGAEYLLFTMKVARTEVGAGIGIWGKLVLGDPFDTATVQAAKDLVAAEATARLGDPGDLYEGAMTKRLFPKFPWRRDPAGSPTTVNAATPEGLQKLRATWLVPGNAVLVVVGDVETAAVVSAAKAAFADWRAAGSPWKTPLVPQPKLGSTRPTWFTLTDPAVPEGLALAEIRYRGPDLATDLPSSVAADLWTALLEAPGGRFPQALLRAVPALHGAVPPTVMHLSQRDGGLISVSATLDIAKPGTLLSLARSLKETFRGEEVTAMRNNPAYFSEAELVAARARLLDRRASALDGIDGLADEIRFAWSSATLDYWRSYPDKVAATGFKEIGAFIDTWILHNLEVVALRINPADAEREGKILQEGGFEAQKTGSAFWWQGR